MKTKRLIIILAIVVVILSIPLTATRLTDEVKWDWLDFLIMGILLFATGVGIEYVLRKTTKRATRITFCLAIGLVFVLIWAELAVGIFGTPFAGN